MKWFHATKHRSLFESINSVCPVFPITTIVQEKYIQLQQLLSEQSELQRELIITRNQLKQAQQQIQRCKDRNTSLRMKLIRLARKCSKMRHFAYHDELTGLPNRNLLLDRLKQAIVQATRQDKQVALLFIDLDKFKDINDRLGHATGDTLLQLVAERLSTCIRYCDTVCRYGGDEFVILLPEISGQKNAVAVTNKIREQLHEPYVIGKNMFTVTASIGSSVCKPNGQSSDDLINQADMAMYRAKASRDQSFRQIMQNFPQDGGTSFLCSAKLITQRFFRHKLHLRFLENQSLL